MEKWKPVPMFEGLYWINHKGQIKNKTGHIIKTHKTEDGIETVDLYGIGQRTRKRITQLLLETYGGQDE